MRIFIATDAWTPQVNGVVRTLQTVSAELEKMGHDVTIVSPDLYPSLPCPTYPEIRLALARTAKVGRRIAEARPDAIHIATEGPLGLATRRWCLDNGIPFTTAYHTQFPEYLAARTRAPADWFWRYISWFHGPARSVLVATPTLARQLESRGLPHTRLWSRGVDLALFRPDGPLHPAIARAARPVQLYVGRVAVEKNLEAFLDADGPGSKVVVGDGPDVGRLKQRYPGTAFVGALHGEALASAYRAADLFVFPSRTDTFGLVIIEALASGLPVAAYPVPGPLDILTPAVGCMSEDLEEAIASALSCSPDACHARAAEFSWASSASQFLAALVSLNEPRLAA